MLIIPCRCRGVGADLLLWTMNDTFLTNEPLEFPLIAYLCFDKLFHLFSSNYLRQNNSLVFSLVGYRSYCILMQVQLGLDQSRQRRT